MALILLKNVFHVWLIDTYIYDICLQVNYRIRQECFNELFFDMNNTK